MQQAASTASGNAARAFQRGDLQQAKALYGNALQAAQSVEDFASMGAALLNLALVNARLDDLPAAHAQVDRILNAARHFGPTLTAQAAARKALLLLDAPDHDGALRWADTAQAGCANPCKLSAVLANIRAHVALERGNTELAAANAAQAAERAAAQNLPSEQASGLRLLGRAQMQLGRTTEAAAALAKALALDRTLGDPQRVALDLLHAADNEERRGEVALAKEYRERALAVYTAAGLSKDAKVLRARLGP